MYALLFASWLSLPLAPFNPLDQDTVATANLHFGFGVGSPNGIISLGPEASAKYELLIIHPFVMRGGVDYRYGAVNSMQYPQGNLHTAAFSVEALYYRGTNLLTGYLGIGAIWAANWFSTSKGAADSLRAAENITNIDLAHQFGYRITLGLRYHRAYSLELAVTELRPDLVKWGRPSLNSLSKQREQIKTGGFSVKVGYLLPISRR